MNAATPFTGLGQRAPRKPRIGGLFEPGMSRTEKLLDILRLGSSRTAQALADALEMPNTAVVIALLEEQVRAGRVRVRRGYYEYVHPEDIDFEAEAAIALLRRRGHHVEI
jgi:hypothetical protein